ncbi:MAG TPA: alpha/beta hydrolase [Fibrobacteria bacterium]|nr:alpha/beta hydrolase [Fibrobacteria bacterium]
MKTILNETDFAWDEAGRGPALVLLHGLPFQKSLWVPQLSGLSKRFRVIAPDLRGFGESGLPGGEPSVDAYADDIAALIAGWRTGPVLLAGHSMGGYVALAFSRRHPELLRGLIFVASRATADDAEAAANRRSVASRLRTESPEFVAEAMLPRMVSTDSRDPRALRSIRRLMDPLRSEGIAYAQLALASRPDSSPLLAAVPCPALVVAGEKDAIVPLSEAGIFAAGFRRGRLEVVEGAGHLLSWEKPGQFNAALEKWVDGL